MNLQKQIEIMETQLGFFEGLVEKMQYMSEFFDKDPQFTQEARNTVRGNICKAIER